MKKEENADTNENYHNKYRKSDNIVKHLIGREIGNNYRNSIGSQYGYRSHFQLYPSFNMSENKILDVSAIYDGEELNRWPDDVFETSGRFLGFSPDGNFMTFYDMVNSKIVVFRYKGVNSAKNFVPKVNLANFAQLHRRIDLKEYPEHQITNVKLHSYSDDSKAIIIVFSTASVAYTPRHQAQNNVRNQYRRSRNERGLRTRELLGGNNEIPTELQDAQFSIYRDDVNRGLHLLRDQSIYHAINYEEPDRKHTTMYMAYSPERDVVSSFMLSYGTDETECHIRDRTLCVLSKSIGVIEYFTLDDIGNWIVGPKLGTSNIMIMNNPIVPDGIREATDLMNNYPKTYFNSSISEMVLREILSNNPDLFLKSGFISRDPGRIEWLQEFVDGYIAVCLHFPEVEYRKLEAVDIGVVISIQNNKVIEIYENLNEMITPLVDNHLNDLLPRRWTYTCRVPITTQRWFMDPMKQFIDAAKSNKYIAKKLLSYFSIVKATNTDYMHPLLDENMFTVIHDKPIIMNTKFREWINLSAQNKKSGLPLKLYSSRNRNVISCANSITFSHTADLSFHPSDPLAISIESGNITVIHLKGESLEIADNDPLDYLYDFQHFFDDGLFTF